MGQGDFVAALGARQTVRAFGDRPVSERTVLEVLDLARRAPSEFNLQPWRVLVCHAVADRERLRACCLDQPQIASSGVAFVVCGSTRDLVERAAAATDDMLRAGRIAAAECPEWELFMRTYYAEDPLRTRLSALRNAVLFAHHLLVSGLALGLDGFWLAGFDEAALRAEFDLGSDLELAGIIGLGWDGERRTPLPRRPLAELLLPTDRSPTPTVIAAR